MPTLSIAGAAVSLAVADRCVLFVIGVSFRASGNQASTALAILLHGNYIKMSRVDAVSEPAEMVQRQAVRHRPNKEFVPDFVRHPLLSINANAAVALLLDRARPEPAPAVEDQWPVLIHFLPPATNRRCVPVRHQRVAPSACDFLQ